MADIGTAGRLVGVCERVVGDGVLLEEDVAVAPDEVGEYVLAIS